MRRDESDGSELVDLSKLTFIDSSGLRTLIDAARRANTGGWRLDVVNANGRVRQVFDITDMDSLIEYYQRPGERAPR
jgi:anti-anti-sigma factor